MSDTIPHVRESYESQREMLASTYERYQQADTLHQQSQLHVLLKMMVKNMVRLGWVTVAEQSCQNSNQKI